MTPLSSDIHTLIRWPYLHAYVERTYGIALGIGISLSEIELAILLGPYALVIGVPE